MSHHDKLGVLALCTSMQATRDIVRRALSFFDFGIVRHPTFGHRFARSFLCDLAVFTEHLAKCLRVEIAGVRRNAPWVDDINHMQAPLNEHRDVERFVQRPFRCVTSVYGQYDLAIRDLMP